jgi:hypothetical protein
MARRYVGVAVCSVIAAGFAAFAMAAVTTGEDTQPGSDAGSAWTDWYADYMVRERAGEELPV